MPELEVIIATDCGSTTTKAILIEKKEGVYRQTFRGEAPTTVEAPFEDVTRGVLNAIQEVEELSGRQILDGERIITPAQGQRGVDIYISTSSAGGGLQMMVGGVVQSMTAEIRDRTASRLLDEARAAIAPPPSAATATDSTPEAPIDLAAEAARLEALAGDQTALQELRDAAGGQLEQIRRSTDLERLRGAIRLADDGDVRAAIAAIEALLEGELDPEARRKAEAALQMLKED